MTEQKRHNLANRWMKNLHGCLLCRGRFRDMRLVLGHVYQEEKGERLAQLANGPILRMVREWRRVIPLCYRCHNRMAKAFNQSVKRWLERTLAYFNSSQNGKEYRMGVPEYIVDMLVKIHSSPMFGKMSQEEYETTMHTLTELARKEKLSAPIPPSSA